MQVWVSVSLKRQIYPEDILQNARPQVSLNKTPSKECRRAVGDWKVDHKITDGVNFMILFHSSQREMRAPLSWSKAEQQFSWGKKKNPLLPCTCCFWNVCTSPPWTFVTFYTTITGKWRAQSFSCAAFGSPPFFCFLWFSASYSSEKCTSRARVYMVQLLIKLSIYSTRKRGGSWIYSVWKKNNFSWKLWVFREQQETLWLSPTPDWLSALAVISLLALRYREIPLFSSMLLLCCERGGRWDAAWWGGRGGRQLSNNTVWASTLSNAWNLPPLSSQNTTWCVAYSLWNITLKSLFFPFSCKFISITTFLWKTAFDWHLPSSDHSSDSYDGRPVLILTPKPRRWISPTPVMSGVLSVNVLSCEGLRWFNDEDKKALKWHHRMAGDKMMNDEENWPSDCNSKPCYYFFQTENCTKSIKIIMI